MHPCSRGQLPSGLQKQDCSQQTEGNDPCPQFNTGKIMTAVFYFFTESGLPLTKRHGHPGGCPAQAAMSVMGLEHMIDKGKLRELGWLKLEKRRLRETILPSAAT